MSCFVCNSDKKITHHHILPKRFFKLSPLVELCQKHHREIEAELFKMETRKSPERRKLATEEYFNVLIKVALRHEFP